jgi:hypothetical protein
LAFIKLESLAFMASKIHRMWLPQEVVWPLWTINSVKFLAVRSA